jgi:hypothetical protein
VNVETGSSQFDVYIDDVRIEVDCNGVIIYDNGIVATNTTKAGYITAGSGGSGTVTIQGAAETRLEASNTITLRPEFSAVVSGAGSFSATIINCYDIYYKMSQQSDSDKITIDVSGLNPHTDSITMSQTIKKAESLGSLILDESNFKVFPSPGNGKITLTGKTELLSNAQIILLNQSGNKVFEFKNNSVTNNVKLDLTHLANGIYFIQIKNNQKQALKKIVIQK